MYFTTPSDKTKLEQVLSSFYQTCWCALVTDIKDQRRRGAKLLERDIASANCWKFEGTFDNYEPSTLPKLFCKYAV
jgi:hypothetical protein